MGICILLVESHRVFEEKKLDYVAAVDACHEHVNFNKYNLTKKSGFAKQNNVY